MKKHALSIQEPYIQLFLLGLKHYETRSTQTHYRGEIYLQTSLREFTGWTKNPLLSFIKKDSFRPGMVVAKGILTDCVPTELVANEEERKWGFYDGARYAWKIDNIQPVEPFPLRGILGLFPFEMGGEP